MPKLKDLLDRRAAITAELEKDDVSDDRVMELRTEYDGLKPKIARAEVIEEAERREAGEPIHGNGDRHLTNEIRSYGPLLGDTLRMAIGVAGDYGRLREIQAELVKRAGKSPEGIFLPTEVFEKRVLTTSAASELVSTDHRPDLYISALTASSVVRSLGATVLNGLVGNLSIPRETDSPAVGWVAENAAISADDANFDAVTLSPKHAGALAEVSRNMILQTSPDVEALNRQVLARNLALAIDAAAIQGGGSNEPTGVLATSGIQSVTSPASLFEATVDAIAKCEIANVGGMLSLLTTPEVRAIAMKAQDGEGLPVGEAVIFSNTPRTFSNQVPKDLGAGSEHGMIVADWSQLLIGIWSEIDILVNPFETTAYSKGNVQIRAMSTVDVALRHKAAFVDIQDVTTSTAAM